MNVFTCIYTTFTINRNALFALHFFAPCPDFRIKLASASSRRDVLVNLFTSVLQYVCPLLPLADKKRMHWFNAILFDLISIRSLDECRCVRESMYL